MMKRNSSNNKMIMILQEFEAKNVMFYVTSSLVFETYVQNNNLTKKKEFPILYNKPAIIFYKQKRKTTKNCN